MKTSQMRIATLKGIEMQTNTTDLADYNSRMQVLSQVLSDTKGFRTRFKSLQSSGSTWLVLRHTTTRPEASEGFINGFAMNVLEIEETVDGLVFSKFKALDIYPTDALELQLAPNITFNSYGMLYDCIEAALQILCTKDFDGEEL